MKKIYNIKVSTLIIVLLPILSILIGYFGVKLYLLSNNNFNDEIDTNRPGVEEIIENNDQIIEESLTETGETNDYNAIEDDTTNTEKKVTNLIDSISFYSIQVGSFSNKENADQFKNELLEEGYHSYYLQNDNYKVFVAASYNQETLAETLDAVKSISPDAFIKRIDLQSQNFSYVINDIDYFEELSQLIANQMNNVNASVDAKKIKEQLNEIEKLNTQLIALNDNNKNIGNQVTKYIDGVRNEMTSLDTTDEESIRKFLEKNINLFMKNFIKN